MDELTRDGPTPTDPPAGAPPPTQPLSGVLERSDPSGRDGASVVPYLGSAGIGLAAMTTLVLGFGLPAAPVFQYGLTFLAAAMLIRRLEDIPRDTDHPVLLWLNDRAVALEGKFGAEFYGIAALATFLHAEVRGIAGIDVSLSDLLASPVGAVVSWLVAAFIESIMNVVWAALWWIQLFGAVDAVAAIGVIAAGWVSWRLLNIMPRRTEILPGFEEEMAGIQGEPDSLAALGRQPEGGRGEVDGKDRPS